MEQSLVTWNKSVEEGLNEMLANVTLPYEAQPLIALAYETARRIDRTGTLEGYSPVANAMLKQIQALGRWITPPAVIEEDPFDALARALAGDNGPT
jgi:hypothetical protein